MPFLLVLCWSISFLVSLVYFILTRRKSVSQNAGHVIEQGSLEYFASRHEFALIRSTSNQMGTPKLVIRGASRRAIVCY